MSVFLLVQIWPVIARAIASAVQVASFPAPPLSFQCLLHAEKRGLACVEKIGEPGDEATVQVQVRVLLLP